MENDKKKYYRKNRRKLSPNKTKDKGLKLEIIIKIREKQYYKKKTKENYQQAKQKTNKELKQEIIIKIKEKNKIKTKAILKRNMKTITKQNKTWSKEWNNEQ